MHDRIDSALAPTYRLLRAVRRRARLVRWAAFNQRELTRLKNNQDARSLQLAEALAAAIEDLLLPEERGPIAQLERARAELEHSSLALQLVRGTSPPRAPGRQQVIVLSAGRIARYASIHRAWGRLLVALVRATKPSQVLEIGTAIGISGAYLATALAVHGGRLVTSDADRGLAAQARRLFDRLGLRNIEQRVEWITAERLPDICGSRRLEFVFADAIKEGGVLLELHRGFADHATEDAVVVYDDVNWSAEMMSAWTTIQDEPSVTTSIDVGRMGIVVLNGRAPRRSRFSFHLS
jgi:predicted O-methyltransferase YrrM